MQNVIKAETVAIINAAVTQANKVLLHVSFLAVEVHTTKTIKDKPTIIKPELKITPNALMTEPKIQRSVIDTPCVLLKAMTRFY